MKDLMDTKEAREVQARLNKKRALVERMHQSETILELCLAAVTLATILTTIVDAADSLTH